MGIDYSFVVKLILSPYHVVLILLSLIFMGTKISAKFVLLPNVEKFWFFGFMFIVLNEKYLSFPLYAYKPDYHMK